MLVDLIQNVSLLVTLALGLQLLAYRFDGRRLEYRVLAGLLFGAVCVSGMMTPVNFAPGVIYDGRSLVLSLAGLFGGGLPTLLAVLISAAYRLYLGGAGALAGTAVILESAALGLILRALRKRSDQWVRPLPLFAFGVLVHVIMLALQLLIPGKVGWDLIRQLGPVILTLYPVAFLLAANVFLVSERYRAGVQRLAESEERYRTLFENNRTMTMLIDPARGVIVDANPAAQQFYGWTCEQMRGKPVAEINTLSQEEIMEDLRAVRESRRDFFRFRHRLADGSMRSVEVYSGPIRFRDQDLLCSTVHDITVRERTEEALRASEAFQRAMIACSPVALYCIDGQGIVKAWNASAERIFGWTTEEVLGHPLPIVPEDQRASFEASLRCLMDGQNIMGQEVLRLRKDGRHVIGRLSASPIVDDAGQVLGIMGAMEDITESRRLEEQLRQAQKMDSIGRLAGGVAHDFNNMLSVILGYSELLLSNLPGDARQRGDLLQIQSAAQRSAQLTRQLLAFARRQTVEPKVVDLNETIESMLKMLGRLIGEHIELNWQPATQLDPIRIDPVQVDQLLANLIVNARDAIGQRAGRITIGTRHAEVDAALSALHEGSAPGRYVCLSVADNGCGMDAETAERIFEPFYTTKAHGEGTGLGLATVYGIVKQNGGLIEVCSVVGAGTTFDLYLPAFVAHQSLGQSGEMGTAGGKETVLLVEDEPSILELGQRMLVELGYRTLTASTPGAALEIARSHAGPIDLLITDVIMPELNGRELARQVLAYHPTVRRLFISGYTADVIAHQGVLEAGVNFLQKPFSLDQLAQKVRQVLDA